MNVPVLTEKTASISVANYKKSWNYPSILRLHIFVKKYTCLNRDMPRTLQFIVHTGSVSSYATAQLTEHQKFDQANVVTQFCDLLRHATSCFEGRYAIFLRKNICDSILRCAKTITYTAIKRRKKREAFHQAHQPDRISPNFLRTFTPLPC